VRFVKWFVFSILLVAAVAGGAGAGYFYVLHPRTRAAPDVRAPKTPEIVERGRYLAHHVAGCMSCHSASSLYEPGDPIDPKMLGSGKEFPEIPGFPGRVRTPNLTPDEQHGLGMWTDGEIARAIREGVSRDGRALFPMMPYAVYRQTLSDDDTLAIVAYLRTLPALAHDPGKMEVPFPVSMFIRAVPRPVEKSPPPAPDGKDRLARGRWLLATMACGDCHTPSEKGKPLPGKSFAGGMNFGALPSGRILYAPNITSDAATGIGAYSDEDLLRVFDEGKNKAGQPLYAMPWPLMKGLTSEDKAALIQAVREIPPVTNAVPTAVR
jgi:mono/diheme cytochrome c family protein